MFDKLKQLKQLKDLQSAAKKEVAEVEREGVRVVVDGNMEILEIHLNPDIETIKQEKLLQDCLNEAMKKIKIALAQKMARFM